MSKVYQISNINMFRPLFCRNTSKLKRLFSTSDEVDLECEKFELKSVRVAILGAGTKTGQALALLLKQNPLVSRVYVQDACKVIPLADDLANVDTRCIVTPVENKNPVGAIRNAEIIVMLGLNESTRMKLQFKFESEAERIIELSNWCVAFAPKALLIDAVYPVSMSLPVISEIYRTKHWYHPGRVFGSVGVLQVCINSILARYQNLNPISVHVPLLGGPEEDIIVPLFSRATPSALPIADSLLLTNRYRKLRDDADIHAKAESVYEHCPYSDAYALNRLVTTAALGLLGDSSALSAVHVRSNFVSTCKNIVTTVKFGKYGIEHNYGVPRLTKAELKLFEYATLEIAKREQLALDFYECKLKEFAKCTRPPQVDLSDSQTQLPQESRLLT